MVELYHLKDVNWRLIINVPTNNAVVSLKDRAKQEGVNLENILNNPQDYNCYAVDIRCDSIEIAKKIFKKLHTKSFKFQSEQKGQNSR